MLFSLLSIAAFSNIIAPIPANNNDIRLPVMTQVAAYPYKETLDIKPIINASAVMSIDLETGKTLFAENENEHLSIASLTKLMTLLVILENHNLDEIVTVDRRATEVEPAKIYLFTNEQITVRDLIKASIIRSANDAALALAYHHDSDLNKFINAMNDKAKALQMNNSHFKNPVGFDDDDQYSTASDLAILARTIYKKPLIQDLAATQNTTIQSIDGNFNHELSSTNQLFSSYLKVFGLKTGTTDEAGQCLISIIESPDGHKILNIVLGSQDRYKDSKILSQWVFDNYKWI